MATTLSQWQAEMFELLSQLPEDGEIARNSIGNLAIYRDDEYVGFIDVLFPSTSQIQ